MSTGTSIIANLGILKNTGLGVNTALINAVTTFNTTNISGSVQRILPNASSELKDILELAPVSFTGFLPTGITVLPGIIETNIPQSVLNQANLLFADSSSNFSVSGFIYIYGAASAYCSQSASMQNTISAARAKSFSDLGVQFNNYTDVITGGISNQFKLSAVPALAAELPNLGTMFDTTILSRISDLGTFVTNLYNLGLGDVGNLQKMVEENEITLDFIDEAEKNLLLKIFEKITGNDLHFIIKSTSFKPFNLGDIRTLADVLNINKLFSSAALDALGPNPSLDSLANKLSNIGGKFVSMAEIGKFLSGLNLTTFSEMQSLRSFLPDNLAEDLNSIISKGSGTGGSIIINDLIGSASGINYANRISNVVDIQRKLLETDADIASFKDYLDQIANGTTVNNKVISDLIAKISSKSTLINILEKANQEIILCAESLVREKQNLQKANIVPGSGKASITDVQNFVSNLNKLSPNNDTLNLGNFLSNLATNDVYGEAIKASIVEGQNLTRMAAFGINVNTNLS